MWFLLFLWWTISREILNFTVGYLQKLSEIGTGDFWDDLAKVFDCIGYGARFTSTGYSYRAMSDLCLQSLLTNSHFQQNHIGIDQLVWCGNTEEPDHCGNVAEFILEGI